MLHNQPSLHDGKGGNNFKVLKDVGLKETLSSSPNPLHRNRSMNLPLKSLRVSRKEILDKNSIRNEKIEFSSKPTSYLPAMKKMSIQNDPPETGLVHPIFSF